MGGRDRLPGIQGEFSLKKINFYCKKMQIMYIVES